MTREKVWFILGQTKDGPFLPDAILLGARHLGDDDIWAETTFGRWRHLGNGDTPVDRTLKENKTSATNRIWILFGFDFTNVRRSTAEEDIGPLWHGIYAGGPQVLSLDNPDSISQNPRTVR